MGTHSNGNARVMVIVIATVCGALPAWSGSKGYEGVKEAVSSLARRDPGAVRTALEAIAAGQGGPSGRLAIVEAVSSAGLERQFAQELETWFCSVLRSAALLERLRQAPEPRELPKDIPDQEAVRSVLVACSLIRRTGSPVRLISPDVLEQLVVSYADQETSLLLARVACSDPSPTRAARSCDLFLKAALTAPARGRRWEPMQRLAVRALAAQNPQDHGAPDQLKHYLMQATQNTMPISVRAEALGALRLHWPEAATAAASAIGKEERTKAEAAQLEQLLVQGETIGARCEALLLLGAAGKTAEVRERLQAKLKTAGLLEKERADVEFAFRLLRGGTP